MEHLSIARPLFSPKGNFSNSDIKNEKGKPIGL